MNPNEPRRPMVLEKVQLESRKVFSVNYRKVGIEERRNDRKLLKNGSINGDSFFVKRQKLIRELPPHPKRILLPIIENQFVFLGGVVLSLTHKAMMTHFGKSMIDFVILRSLFGIGLLLYLLFEIYDIKAKISMLVTTKRLMRDLTSLDSSMSGGNFLINLSKNSKLLLFIWMFISSIFTISQPLVDKFFPIQMISLSQPFAPVTSLIIFSLLTYKINEGYMGGAATKDKTVYTRLDTCSSQSCGSNNIGYSGTALESTKITERIKLEAEKLFQRSRMIADNKASSRNILVIVLIFASLFLATPIRGVMIYLEKTTLSFLICGIIPILILPSLHDVFFHLICNKILRELMADQIESSPQHNLDFTRIRPIDDLKRKLCNVYIHLFMVLGQILIVLPVCFGIKAVIYMRFFQLIPASGDDISNLSFIGSIVESLFDIDKKELVSILFSVISMLGIYQRCKINNVETFGLTGLMAVQGFQTLLSTSLKSSWSIWISNNFVGLTLSIMSIVILKIQDIVGTAKILYLYARWILYFNNEVVAGGKGGNNYECENVKSYKSNIRIIGGTIDINPNTSGSGNSNMPHVADETLMDDEVSLKSDTESENKAKVAFLVGNSKSNGIITPYNYIKTSKNNYIETPIMSAKVVVLQN